MPVESWITPDDTPALAAQAAAHIDATLARLTPAERTAFWASVRKCYNTPYNDPKPRALPTTRVVAQVLAQQSPLSPLPDLERPRLDLPSVAMPVAAMRGPGFGTETHAS